MTQKLFVYLWIAILLPAGALQAKPVPVRSGAHEDFVRIALDVPTGTAWTLHRGKQSAKIVLRDHTEGFDLEGVYRRIDKNTVSSIASTSNELRIRFNCDCEATAYRQGDRMIVLDISEREAESIEFELTIDHLPMPPDMTVTSDQPLRFREQLEAKTTKLPAFPTVVKPTSAAPPKMELSVQDFDEIDQATQSETVGTEILAQAQKRLAKRVGTAATQGVLRPNRSQMDLAVSAQRPHIDISIFDSAEYPALENEDPPAPIAGNLMITSSNDVALVDPKSKETSTVLGVPCLEPARAAVSKWGTELPMMTKVSELRQELFSEFDKLNRDVALDLARLYLHYGFGAEARQVLSLDQELMSEHRELLEISDIMDYGGVPDPEYLRHFIDCESEVALWAILATSTVPASRTINAEAALRALTSLPMFLRGFIAPELSRRLLEYGDADGAAAALRSVERAAEPVNAATNLARANLHLSEENVEHAQVLLADVVASNEQQSAEALIKFVDVHLAAGTEIDENVATLVESYALEMRDHPVGAELRRTHVLALAKSGQFDAAFEALHRIYQSDNAKTKRALNTSLIELLTNRADDIVFLDHTFSQIESSQSWDDTGIIFPLAERLVSLGFTDQAETFLLTQSGVTNEPRARLLRSRIALLQDRPSEVQALLFGIASDDADRLRAAASLRLGNYADAQAIYLRLGDEHRREQADMLSENWTDLLDSETSVFASAAQLASTPLSDDPSVIGMLARANASIEESVQARDAIRSMLQPLPAHTE